VKLKDLDDKQRHLIDAWLERAFSENGDEYGQFMAAWLAFNALCYAYFGKRAMKQRPDLSKKKGLSEIAGRVSTNCTIESKPDGRVTLEVFDPGPIRIDIRDRYTEDLVFSEFSRRYREDFVQWLRDPYFLKTRDTFLEAIERPGSHYVINMLKIGEHDTSLSLGDLKSRSIVKAIDKPDDLGQFVDALYQVRCNVFHGEKVPGEPNDDRIVRVARPLVGELVRRALE
jgi:hypothetical protein